MLSKITKIRPSEHKGETFNLEIEEDNSYIANGVVVHNCDPTSGKDKFFDIEVV